MRAVQLEEIEPGALSGLGRADELRRGSRAISSVVSSCGT